MGSRRPGGDDRHEDPRPLRLFDHTGTWDDTPRGLLTGVVDVHHRIRHYTTITVSERYL